MFSSTNATFVVSKLILGFGLGFYLTLAPLATSEIAPVVLRGISTASVNLGVAMGQLLSNAIIKGFGERTDHWAYRGPFAAQLFFVAFLAHFVGIIFVLGYSTYFFQLAGLAEAKSFDLGVGVTAYGVASNICSWFVVNSFGRRKIFLSGMVSLTALLLLISIIDIIPNNAAKWIQAAYTVIYSFVYFATVGAMAFAILGECYSIALKAKTIALATATQAIMGIAINFAIPYIVNPDKANLKGKVGFIFGGLALLAMAWSWAFIPELKGRRYDEINRLFEQKVSPRQMGSYQLRGLISH
ncbi:hypothetical protein NW759_017146 [Fusarium solani]|nr:hypothetical protein NW759_017146 [Fusarium solani]